MTPAAATVALALLARADAPTVDPAEPLPGRPTLQPRALETHEMRLDLGPEGRSVPALIAMPPPSQAGAAAWADFCKRSSGAAVFSAAGDYLGRIADRFDPDSIFNPLGAYGGSNSVASIWNASGQFGGATGPHSPFNRTGNPPRVVAGDEVIALLSDRDVPGAAHPATVARMCYGTDEYREIAPDQTR